MTKANGKDGGEVLARVARICSEQLGVDENEVTRNASFRDDLGADSLDLVELAMSFEEEFGIPEIDDETGERIMTNVGAAVDYIQAQFQPGTKSAKAGRS